MRSNVVAYRAAHAAFVFKDGHERAEYERALPDLVEFYTALRGVSDTPFDVDEAARRELEWWIVHRERDRHAPVVAAGEERARAVDRIDDPHALGGQARRLVLGLLREPAVGDTGRGEPLAQQRVDREVGLAHRRVAGLHPGPDLALERPKRQRARFAHRPGKSVGERGAVDRLRRPQRSAPRAARSAH